MSDCPHCDGTGKTVTYLECWKENNMNDEKKQIDCEYTDEIVCPYCGYEFHDSWEYNEDDGKIIKCQDCAESFRLDVNYTVSYVSSTQKDTP